MPKFRKKPVVIEARQLVGPAGETMRVAEWVRENGYPWLLGDATRPETLTPENDASHPGRRPLDRPRDRRTRHPHPRGRHAGDPRRLDHQGRAG